MEFKHILFRYFSSDIVELIFKYCHIKCECIEHPSINSYCDYCWKHDITNQKFCPNTGIACNHTKNNDESNPAPTEYNIFIGNDSGYNTTDRSNSIWIGNESGYDI